MPINLMSINLMPINLKPVALTVIMFGERLARIRTGLFGQHPGPWTQGSAWEQIIFQEGFMDFSLSDQIKDFRRRVREFVEDELIPLEKDPATFDEYETIRIDLLQEIRAKVKRAGLWAPQIPKQYGGQGLSIVGMAACYEEMNRSLFGPVCFNCAAPDDGTMIVLNKVLPEEQKARWLQPIIDGEVQSAFCMTEPHPGAGSDPSMMITRAEKKGGKWVVYGRKWFITGAAQLKHTGPNKERFISS